MRKLLTDPFTRTMTNCNSSIAMDSSASKGFSKWVNKDLKQAEKTGDWSILMTKALQSTTRFRNSFYK